MIVWVLRCLGVGVMIDGIHDRSLFSLSSSAFSFSSFFVEMQRFGLACCFLKKEGWDLNMYRSSEVEVEQRVIFVLVVTAWVLFLLVITPVVGI